MSTRSDVTLNNPACRSARHMAMRRVIYVLPRVYELWYLETVLRISGQLDETRPLLG
jgi:sensor c-di-GMP phosphodiesterase-like protein